MDYKEIKFSYIIHHPQLILASLKKSVKYAERNWESRGDQCIAYASDLAGMQLSVILIFHTSLMMLAGIPQKKTVCMLGLFLLPEQE